MMQAPEELDYFEVSARGRALKVSYTARVLSILQKDLGHSIDRVLDGVDWSAAKAWDDMRIGSEIFRRIQFEDLIKVWWHGLQRYHPEITLEDAGDLIHQGNAVRVLTELAGAFRALFGIGEVLEEHQGEEEVERRGPFGIVGTSSG